MEVARRNWLGEGLDEGPGEGRRNREICRRRSSFACFVSALNPSAWSGVKAPRADCAICAPQVHAPHLSLSLSLSRFPPETDQP